jgi:hypothetical protein
MKTEKGHTPQRLTPNPCTPMHPYFAKSQYRPLTWEVYEVGVHRGALDSRTQSSAMDPVLCRHFLNKAFHLTPLTESLFHLW